MTVCPSVIHFSETAKTVRNPRENMQLTGPNSFIHSVIQAGSCFPISRFGKQESVRSPARSESVFVRGEFSNSHPRVTGNYLNFVRIEYDWMARFNYDCLASQNGKTRAKTAKRKLKWQNAS